MGLYCQHKQEHRLFLLDNLKQSCTLSNPLRSLIPADNMTIRTSSSFLIASDSYISSSPFSSEPVGYQLSKTIFVLQSCFCKSIQWRPETKESQPTLPFRMGIKWVWFWMTNTTSELCDTPDLSCGFRLSTLKCSLTGKKKLKENKPFLALWTILYSCQHSSVNVGSCFNEWGQQKNSLVWFSAAFGKLRFLFMLTIATGWNWRSGNPSFTNRSRVRTGCGFSNVPVVCTNTEHCCCQSAFFFLYIDHLKYRTTRSPTIANSNASGVKAIDIYHFQIGRNNQLICHAG